MAAVTADDYYEKVEMDIPVSSWGKQTKSRKLQMQLPCYEWNGLRWDGYAPSNPVNTECGNSICIPCIFDIDIDPFLMM